jgi:hypothetical protein
MFLKKEAVIVLKARELFIVFLLLMFNQLSWAQSEEKNNKGIEIFAGVKTRVTPIYIDKVPDFIRFVGFYNVFEQPDKHLSGPGINLIEKVRINNKWIFSLNQTIRYDYIYQRMPLVNPTPDGFDYRIGKKIIIDLYADFSKRITLSKPSFFTLMAGIGICGLNSGFYQTRRLYQTQTDYVDYITKRNFIFPAVSTGLGWQKNRIYAELKIGYCWNNPTLFNTPFIFPEVSLQYKLFKLKNEKKK